MNIQVNTGGISPYAVFILLSYLAGYAYATLRMRKEQVPGRICFYTIMLTMFCSVYLAVYYTKLTSGTYGLSSMGGMFGIILGITAMSLIAKGYKEAIVTNYITALPLIYGISKIGCFLVGCCHGIPYEGWGSVAYYGSAEYLYHGRVFPVQLLETIVFLLIFAGAVGLRQKKWSREIIIMVCASMKFSLDYLRISHVGQSFSINQVFCLVTLIGSIGVLVWKAIYTKKERKDC